MALIGALAAAGCADPAGDAAGRQAAREADRARAESAFAAYQSALAERRGDDAAALVSSGTLAYYESARRLALTALADELGSRSAFDRLTVVSLRVGVPADQLAAGTPAELFAAVVDAGLVGQQVGALVVRSTSVDGDLARVQLVAGAGQLITVEVRREGDEWRVDVTGLIPLADAAISQLAAAQGIAEDELILATLSAITGRTIGPEVFNPPLP
ncbi:MAG: hypothetical protein ACRD29_20195 [Acidimicrobiales bacterium]